MMDEEQKLAEEEKKWGVDHYDDEILRTGDSHCLKAYLDFRALSKPVINPYFMRFSQQFEI